MAPVKDTPSWNRDEPLEAFGEDGTLFKSTYNSSSRGYMVTSRTPVEGCVPLVLHKFVTREEADKFKERNWVTGYSTNTAALQVGREYLEPQIADELRIHKDGIVVRRELEALEGFGSF